MNPSITTVHQQKNEQVSPYAFEPEYTPEELAERELDDGHGGNVVAVELEVEDDVPLDDEGHEDGTQMPLEEWCMCRGCMVMPTNFECDCCQDINAITTKLEEATGGDIDHVDLECITQHPDFQAVCLNRAVLDTIVARLHYAFIERLEDNNPTNK
ncbi:uncharacterized protein LOC135499376 [Lineus longissimus]|uniref:uncharacterized protein LOC135499376 n=1 Tax=Lineus longissimus TaxID=88925 RepID=UPI00315D022F